MSNAIAKKLQKKQTRKTNLKRINGEKVILLTPCYTVTSIDRKFVPVLFNIIFLGTINVGFIFPSCTRSDAGVKCSNKEFSRWSVVGYAIISLLSSPCKFSLSDV